VLLASGQRSVPVLRDDGQVVTGSAAIIDHLEQSRPQPPLYPADPADRSRALELQRWFDEEVGVPLRAAFYFELLPDTDLPATFSGCAGHVARALYRAIFPAVRAAMRRDMDITIERAERGLKRSREAFDLVAKQSAATGYLIGDRFSVADLTAAAILSPAVLPPEFPYLPHLTAGGAFDRWQARWRNHPGAGWVREIYRRHRGISAELSDS
jgi:glutathione S-transferase